MRDEASMSGDLQRNKNRLPVEGDSGASQTAGSGSSVAHGYFSHLELDQAQFDLLAARVPGGAENIQQILPLAPIQEGILFDRLFRGGGDTYILSLLFELQAAKQRDALIDALQKVVNRHEALRSAICWEGLSKPVQVVYRAAALNVDELALGDDVDPVTQLTSMMRTSRQSMDLRQAPLLRLAVTRRAVHGRWYALMSVHHLICDHRSLQSVATEALEIVHGREHKLAAPGSYAEQIRQMLSMAQSDQETSFFANKLQGIDGPSAPFGLLAVRAEGNQIEEARQVFEPALVSKARAQASAFGVSAARLFHAAWALVVAHTSGRDDIVYGTVLPATQGDRSNAQRTIGMSVNTLPLRLQLAGLSVAELLKLADREITDLLNYRQASLALAQSCSELAGATPLFTSLLNCRRAAPGAVPTDSESTAPRIVARDEAWTSYPVTLTVDDLGDQVLLIAQADRRIGPVAVIEYFQVAVQSLVDALEHSPQTLALALSSLPDWARQQVTESFNATDAAYPHEKSVQQLFEERVQETPDGVALECGEQSLSYAELNRQANRLARYLRQQGVEIAERIPILMPRCSEMVVAQLAVLKAGGVYVPLDVYSPVERQRFMIEDCGARRVLCLAASLASECAASVQSIDVAATASAIASLPADNLPLEMNANLPAYVMYTSGSTGTPKGVIVPHQAINRLVINNGYATLEATDRIAHGSNPAFDAATFEIWGALLNGARVVVIPQSVLFEAGRLARELIDKRVTILWLTIGLFSQYADTLAAALRGLRYLIVGGDVVDPGLVRRVREASCPGEFLAAYGPTECTTFSSTYAVRGSEAERQSIPIGRPMANARLYILDESLKPAPVGVPGEIYIGGAGLASGYLNRPELTAQRFVANPFHADSGARLYRSGDLGRWRADGNVEFLGRNDQQVKIRGFRVELAEIEAHILKHPEITQALVVAHQAPGAEKRLIAYLVRRERSALSAEDLRQHLGHVLPEYMVPGALVFLEKFPLTANGKVNRKALPLPDALAYAHAQYVAPEGATEQLIAETWRELLQVNRIGRHDSFFSLGGHSILAMRVMARLRSLLSIDAPVSLLFEFPSVVQFSRQVDELRAGGAPIVDAKTDAREHGSTQRIQPYARGASAGAALLPASSAQHRLWLIDQFEGGAAYHIPIIIELQGTLHEQALRNALDAIVQRHEVLRTTFVKVDDEPRQEIRPDGHFPLRTVDLRNCKAARRAARVEFEKVEEAHAPFDLRTGPLIRARLLVLSGAEHILLVTMHHIVADGWSLDVFFREFSRLYEAYCTGDRKTLAPLPIQYSDYAQWQRQNLRDSLLDGQLTYWRGRLQGAATQLELPTDRPRPATQSYQGGNASLVLDEALVCKLREFSRQHEATLFMSLYAAWAILLSRLSAQEDIVIGSPVANRQLPELEGLIGFFVNTLVLRISVSGELRVDEFMARVKQVTLGAYDHQDIPFDHLVETLQPERVANRNPYFQVMLVLQSSPKSELSLPGLTVNLAEGSTETSKFDLLLSIEERGGRLVGTVSYATDLFERATIERWIAAYVELLEDMLRDSHAPIGSLSIVPQSQRRTINRFNATDAPYSRDTLVHQLFEEQAALNPNAAAIVHGEKSFTYADINGRANQLARYLREQGVVPGDLVGICIERSVEMVVGLIGALKAGAAYVPMDPHYPPERLAYMAENAAPSVLLTEAKLAATLPATRAKVVALDSEAPQIGQYRAGDLSAAELQLQADSLVYVIYTSGSTGRPKGIGMPHHAMVNLMEWHRQEFHAGKHSRTLQFAALSFDVACQEIFSTLSVGAALVLVDEWVRRDIRSLAGVLNDQRVNRMFLPPLMLQALAEFFVENPQSLSNQYLTDLVTAGEQLRISDEISLLFEHLRECRLHNHYGPTETHVVTALTLSGEPKQWPALPAIGKPVSNARIHILDSYLRPAPIGIAGEIYIGGACVADGYVGAPELTVQRFMADIFDARSGARLYRTGDLGYWRANGLVEYVGRNDDQVKVRGYRIELGEIESSILSQGGVKEAAVVVREDQPGEKHLVAYVILREKIASSIDELRAHLKQLLPGYMVPSAFVLLDDLPLTPNGKLDRRALPAPQLDTCAREKYEPLQGEVEQSLARIWKELLRIERVGRHDNFFQLGGHSLLIVKMMERLRKVGLSGDVREVYGSTSLADLANTLSSRPAQTVAVPPNLIPHDCAKITPQMLPLVDLSADEIERIVRFVPGGEGNVQDIYPLVSLQQGILFHHLFNEQGGDTYLLPILFSLPSEEKFEDFCVALRWVMERHEVLRTAVLWEHLPQAVQVVQRKVPLTLEEIALVGNSDPVEQLSVLMAVELQKLDLRQAPMRVRFAVDPKGPQRYVLMQLHHLICDHESLYLMFAEITAHMNGYAHKLPHPGSYRRHVAQSLAHSRTHDAQSYFRSKLKGIEEPTAPFGLLDVHGDGGDAQHADRKLETSLLRRIRFQASRLGVSTATMFHAAWALVVAGTSDRDDVVFGTVLLGRLQSSAGAERTLGMFINTLPLRLRLAGMSIEELIKQAHQELTQLLTHEQASLADAQRCSDIVGSAPVFTALLNYRWSTVDIGAQFSEGGMSFLGIRSRTNYPIVLSVDDLGDVLVLEADTDPRIDANRIIGCMQAALRSVVEALEQNPQSPALALSILADDELHQVTQVFNATRADYPTERMVHQLIEEQAKQTPTAAAVECDGQVLTYAELNTRANRLARQLRTKGVVPDQIVAICTDRGMEMIVGLLGILKAGGAYMPLDPTYPKERLEYMLSDAASKVSLGQDKYARMLASAATEWISLDGNGSMSDGVAGEDMDDGCASELRSHHLAYVIYTSGSTGAPKGVLVEHRNLSNLVWWHRAAFDVTAGSLSSSVASIGFDAATWEIWASLCAGAKLILASSEVAKDTDRLLQWWATQPLQISFMPTPIADFILAQGIRNESLQTLLVGGDRLHYWPPSSSLSLINNYGPTESTVVASSGRMSAEDPVLHIGRPIANTRIYIIDRFGKRVAVGVTGEIYIGGAGVARGYLNRPELTAERFLPDPFSDDSHARLYKTGDLARWRPDGTIEYIGRNDDQVKIRGYRIELGEIETQLARHEAVGEALIIAREDAPGEIRLIAYVVPSEKDGASVEDLRAHLLSVVPEYMVPSAFVLLDCLPLMPNGKLDRRALPEPELGWSRTRVYEPPQGEIEQALAEIWEELLHTQPIGRHDNFFELGGHSLVAVKLMVRVAQRLSAQLTVQTIFKNSTIAQLAEKIELSSADTGRLDAGQTEKIVI